MAETLEYILSLSDGASSTMKRIGISSDGALDKFSELQQQATQTGKLLKDMGGAVGSLRSKLDLLKAERDWIPAENIQDIRAYNREIAALENQIENLNNAGSGKNLKEFFSNTPVAGLWSNPIAAAGEALFNAGKMAVDFDDGLSKINASAGLSKSGLNKLKGELLSIDPKYVDNWSMVPGAYQEIIDQTGDVSSSMDILQASLKGAKAANTDVSIVSAAVAESLSLIGEEGASAQNVMDTFISAKSIGGGSFESLAQVMPGLIKSGQSLGISFKETAGVFAFMTSKGQSAEQSAALMEKAYAGLGNLDVQNKLQGEGINVFDESGSVRSMTDIFGDLKARMAGMSGGEQTSFLAKMGLGDGETSNAFMLMMSDMKNLDDSIKGVANSQGSTDKAFEASRSTMDKLREVWSNVQLMAIDLGGVLLSALVPVLDMIVPVISAVASGFSWFVSGLQEGNPWLLAIVGVIAALTAAHYAAGIAASWQLGTTKLQIIATKAGAAANAIATGATWLWNTAQWALNAAFTAFPIFTIIAGVAAITAGIYALANATMFSSAQTNVDNEVKSRVIEKTAQQRAELDMLFNTLQTAKQGSDEFNQTLRDLEAMQPGIVEKYNLQAGAMGDIAGAQTEMIKNMDLLAQAEAMKELSVEKYKEAFKQQAEGPSIMDHLMGGFMPNGGNIMNGLDVAKAKAEAKEANKQLVQLQASKDYKKALSIEKSKELTGAQELVGNTIPPGTGTGKKGSGVSSAGSKTNESIATGGTKQTTINLTFRNIVENIAVSGRDFREGATEMGVLTGDALLRALALATTTAG